MSHYYRERFLQWLLRPRSLVLVASRKYQIKEAGVQWTGKKALNIPDSSVQIAIRQWKCAPLFLSTTTQVSTYPEIRQTSLALLASFRRREAIVAYALSRIVSPSIKWYLFGAVWKWKRWSVEDKMEDKMQRVKRSISQEMNIRPAYIIVVVWSRVSRMWMRRVIDSIDNLFCYGILIIYIIWPCIRL